MRDGSDRCFKKVSPYITTDIKWIQRKVIDS